jgi:hypothetical protein
MLLGGREVVSVRQISTDRLADFERRLGTGHTVVDARGMIREIRRLEQFMLEEAQRLSDEGHAESARRLMEAATTPW